MARARERNTPGVHEVFVIADVADAARPLAFGALVVLLVAYLVIRSALK